MRTSLALLVALCIACGGSTGGDCVVDADCSGEVCARNSECLPTSAVRVGVVTWTIRGMTASATTCASSPSFYLLFSGAQLGDTFGYEPVPCDAGRFTIDKLPKRFVSVEIGETGGFTDNKAFDAQGNVAFDLFP